MREIRQSGSEGGGGREASPYLYTICRRSAAKYSSPLKRVQAPRSPGSDRPLTILREAVLNVAWCREARLPNLGNEAAAERRQIV